MKNLLFISLFFIALFGTANLNTTEAQPNYGYSSFYYDLSSHGRWIELEPGFVVWKPRASMRWAPYSSGHWIWTNYGWYWDSYEPFGHVVYHYGRWFYDDYYGWLWVPGDEWAPAWVEWRYDDNYIGWSPLPPYAYLSVSLGIHYSVNYIIPYNHWHFVKFSHFHHNHVYKYYVPSKVKYRTYSNTRGGTHYEYRNNSVYNRGIDPNIVRERTKTNIRETNISFNNGNTTGRDPIVRNNERIEVNYRPQNREINVKERNIEKSDRKTTLDIKNVRTRESGNNNTNERQNIERQNQDSRIIRNEVPNPKVRETEIQKNSNQNQEIKKERETIQRQDVQIKRENNTERNNGNIQPPKREEKKRIVPEVKRENVQPKIENNTRNQRNTQINTDSNQRKNNNERNNSERNNQRQENTRQNRR